MASSSQHNFHATTATALSNIHTRDEAQRIFHAALKTVRQMPEFKHLSADLVDKITTFRNAEDLKDAFDHDRAQSRLWKVGRSGSGWKVGEAVYDHVMRFKDSADKLSQMSPMVALPIWSSVCFVATVAGELFAAYHYLDTFQERVASCLERFNAYYLPDLRPDEPLRRSLENFYASIIRFFLDTALLFTASPKRTTLKIVKNSIKPRLEKLLRELEHTAQGVDTNANAKTHKGVNQLLRRPAQRMSASPTLVISSTSSTKRAPLGVPSLLARHFVGRNQCLLWINQCLQVAGRTAPVRTAIWGIPGVGKSQILLQYITNSQSSGLGVTAYTQIIFVRAGSRSAILSQYRMFSNLLGLSEQESEWSQDDVVVEKFKNWLGTNDNWLLVFDNVQDPHDVAEFAPPFGSGHLLFATRSEITARALAGHENSFHVQPLARESAMELVGRLAPPHLLLSSQALDVRERVADFAGCLPIAIDGFVKLAELKQKRLDALFDILVHKRDFLRQSHPASFHDQHLSTGALLTVILEELARKSPEAVELFKLLVYYDVSSIPIGMLVTGISELDEHFKREHTFERGRVPSPEDVTDAQIREVENEPFRWLDHDPFELATYVKGFRAGFHKKKSPETHLPRVDSTSDQRLAQLWDSAQALRNVFHDRIQLDHALNQLYDAGVIRRLPNDNAVWIHDLYAELTVALCQEESVAKEDVRAHLANTTVYLAFPIPDYFKPGNMEKAVAYLTHARSALRHLLESGTYNNSTIGAELSHLVACTLHVTSGRSFFEGTLASGRTDLAEAIKHLKLAVEGYAHAQARLLARQDVTMAKIAISSFADILHERHRARAYSLGRTVYGAERFGHNAGIRCLHASLKLGWVLTEAGQLDEALHFIKQGCSGIELIFGAEDADARDALEMLWAVYDLRGDHDHAHEIAMKRMTSFIAWQKRDFGGGGLVVPFGSSIARDIGISVGKLGRKREALVWFEIELMGLETRFGKDPFEGTGTMLRLGRTHASLGNFNAAASWVAEAIGVRTSALRVGLRHEKWVKDALVELAEIKDRVEVWDSPFLRIFVEQTLKSETFFSEMWSAVNCPKNAQWDLYSDGVIGLDRFVF